MFVNFLSKFTLKTCQKQYWTKSQHTILKFVRKCQTASFLNRQSCREITIVQRRTIVSVEVDQLGTVLEHDRDHGVLYHLAKLHLAQRLEAGARHQARPRQPGIAAIADTGRGLETVFELDGEYFELIWTRQTRG